MGVKEDKKIIQDTANKIKEARVKKGLFQVDVAKKVGIDSNSYAKVERGESKSFGYAQDHGLFGVTLVKIKRALGVKYSDILPD